MRYVTVLKGRPERVVVSYDLWEEQFAVTILGASKRTRSGLTVAQAEAWTIDNLAISALGVPPDRPFWLRFELRTASPKELSRVVGESGISLRGLVEFFSRKPTPDDPIGRAAPDRYGFRTCRALWPAANRVNRLRNR